MAFFSGPPCPLASGGGGFGQWDPGGDGGCCLFKVAVGRQASSITAPVSPPPPLRPVVEMGWLPGLACLGLSQETCVCTCVPGKPALQAEGDS